MSAFVILFVVGIVAFSTNRIRILRWNCELHLNHLPIVYFRSVVATNVLELTIAVRGTLSFVSSFAVTHKVMVEIMMELIVQNHNPVLTIELLRKEKMMVVSPPSPFHSHLPLLRLVLLSLINSPIQSQAVGSQ